MFTLYVLDGSLVVRAREFQTHVDYATDVSPHSVAVGDFNGDRKVDLVTANLSGNGTVSVLLGNGEGTFQGHVDYAVGVLTISVAVGDFNGDGKLDLVAANESYYPFGTVSVLLGNGEFAGLNYPPGPWRPLFLADCVVPVHLL